MATFNTTYNYNQQSMNFGQAMLYGAFGQLTGMMGMGGCFGGGYGMGSYGMGMGGSLFSMMGGFGYGCGIPDSYVGAQVGLATSSALFQCIGGAISSHREEKATAVKAQETASKNVETLKTKKDKLDAEKTKLSESFNINDDVPSGIKSVFPTESDTYTAKLKTVKEIPGRTDDYYIKNNTTVSGINSRTITPETTGEGENAKTVYKYNGKTYDTNEAAQAAKKQDLDDAIAQAKEKDLEKANDELQTAYDTLKEKISKRLGEIETELSTNKTELEKAKASEKISSKCDTDSEYSAIVGEYKNGKFIKDDNDLKIDNDNKDDVEKAFNYKFRQYCNCGTTTDADKAKKQALKDELLALYEVFGGSATSEMRQKKDILESGKIAFGLS